MINWLRLVVSCASIVCMTQVLADTTYLPQSQDDPNGCSNFIQQGNSNPPEGTTDPTTISNIQSCLASCGQLYQSYADQGQYDEMNAGISYCRTNLTALYNQSLFLQANSNLAQADSSTQDGSASGGAANPNAGASVNGTEQPSLLQKWLHPNENNASGNSSGNSNTDAASAPNNTDSAKPNNNKNKSDEKQINWF